MSEIDFSKYDDEKLIDLVSQGIGSHRAEAAHMELRRRLNKTLCESITTLDNNIQVQNEHTTRLTFAMYVLTAVLVGLAILQIWLIL